MRDDTAPALQAQARATPPETAAPHEARRAAQRVREHIPDALGVPPILTHVQVARCTEVHDPDHHRARFDLGLPEGPVPVYYWPTTPAVGSHWPVRTASQHLERWTRTASGAWLYWFDLTRNAGYHTLLKTAWPLATAPTADTIVEVLRWSRVPAFGGLYTTTTLLGIDGAGTVFAERGGHTVAAANETFTAVARAPLADPTALPVEHQLPMRSATGALTFTPDRTNLFLMRAQALAWGGARAGVVVGLLPSVSLLLNPTLGVYDATSNDTLDYSLSTDGGASWTLHTSLPYQPSHWQARVDEPSEQAIYSTWFHVPAGRLFAWIADTSAEATTLGVGTASIAWLAGMTDYHGGLVGLGNHPGGTDLPYDLGGSVADGSFTPWASGVNRFGLSPQLLLTAAGVEGGAAYRVLRAAAGMPPSWVRTTDGVGGPWAPVVLPDANTALEMIGLDRTFTQGLVAYTDNDSGLVTGLAATEDGTTWTALSAAQLTAFTPTLYPDTAARGWIVAA